MDLFRFSGPLILFVWVATNAEDITSESTCLSRHNCDYNIIKKLAELEVQQTTLQETLGLLQTKISTLTETLKALEPVAFQALLSQNTPKLAQGTTVVFDDVFLNVGNGYDPHHGVFTSYRRGIYFFIAKFSSDEASNIWIVKGNGSTVSYDYSFITGQGWQSRVAVATMELNVGDKVWVEGNEVIKGYAPYTWPTEYRRCYHSTFTGHMISGVPPS